MFAFRIRPAAGSGLKQRWWRRKGGKLVTVDTFAEARAMETEMNEQAFPFEWFQMMHVADEHDADDGFDEE